MYVGYMREPTKWSAPHVDRMLTSKTLQTLNYNAQTILYQVFNISFQGEAWTSFRWNKQSSPDLRYHGQVKMDTNFCNIGTQCLTSMLPSDYLNTLQVQSAVQSQAKIARPRVLQKATYAWVGGCWSQVGSFRKVIKFPLQCVNVCFLF